MSNIHATNVVRLYADDFGESRFESVAIPMFHKTFAGRFRVTASSGETRSIVAGDCLLMEDTSGKGHITEVTSDLPVRADMIGLA